MKRITVENYRTDKYYPRIVRAVGAILGRKEFVSPIELFVEMGLSSHGIEEWRAGRLPYLEKAIQCNLTEKLVSDWQSRSGVGSPSAPPINNVRNASV